MYLLILRGFFLLLWIDVGFYGIKWEGLCCYFGEQADGLYCYLREQSDGTELNNRLFFLWVGIRRVSYLNTAWNSE